MSRIARQKHHYPNTKASLSRAIALRRHTRGFTLIELLVAIAVLGSLVAIVIPQFSS